MFAINAIGNTSDLHIFTRRRPPHQSLPFDFPRQRGDPINCSHLRGVEDGFRGVLLILVIAVSFLKGGPKDF